MAAAVCVAAAAGLWAWQPWKPIQNQDELDQGRQVADTSQFGQSTQHDARKSGKEKPSLPAEERIALAKPKVTAFCGACHAVPTPDRAPKEDWKHEVEQAYMNLQLSPRKDLVVPNAREVTEYYELQAVPKADIKPPLRDNQGDGNLRFKTSAVRQALSELKPFVSHINVLPATDGEPAKLLYCDMLKGSIAVSEIQHERTTSYSIAEVRNPCHVEPIDLDQDGKLDLLVADLGAFRPVDHKRGQVAWLRRKGEGRNAYEMITLADSIGRVADIQAADFDQDHDLDLIVAEFGWKTTGSIRLLINDGERDGQWSFHSTIVDPRHGSIHVPVTDLNGDGLPDFVALISQEYESIEGFINQGGGKFVPTILNKVEDPSYASTGIEMVDLDGDQDLDVLYTNGDGFDAPYMKPYHAVQWLENTGKTPYDFHHLTLMPGVHRALAADMDGDGDQDIVAVSNLSEEVIAQYPADSFDSIIWLEQTSPGKFVRHALETGSCHYCALLVRDLDGDGDFDFAVGHNYPQQDFGGELQSAMTIWWNELK